MAREFTDHTIPFLPSASDSLRQGLVRVVNESDRSGMVRIVAIDDSGRRYDELTLEIAANAVAHIASGDLEMGNPDIGLTGSTGAGQGDWRLELASDLEIEPRAYANKDGFLTAMHDTAPRRADGYRVAVFNPGSNHHQVSRIRLVNAGETASAVTIRGTDDEGASPGSDVTVEVRAGEARTFTAAELESGAAAGLTGALGDGEGKWRLDVEATEPVQVMSLLASPGGHLTNLSTVPSHQANGVHRVPLFPPASDPFGRQGFVRVVNHSNTPGEVRIEASDDTDWAYDPLTLSLDAGEAAHFNSDDLELGNTDKGLAGSTGPGEGGWRLELTSELDIEVLSYIRTQPGGYVTAMHDTAPEQMDVGMRYYVPVFQPEAYDAQESRLQVANLGDGDASVVISGTDDSGESAPGGEVRFDLPAGAARTLTADQLERGADGLTGSLETGEGKWRLNVVADQTLQVMSLGHSPEGPLANLSRGRPPVSGIGPDLVVESVIAGETTVNPGENFTLTATVHNQGAVAASGTTLRFFRSIDEDISTEDVEMETRTTDALVALAMSEISVAVTAESSPGRYYYGACVDAVGGESRDANNCSSSLRMYLRGADSGDWGGTKVVILSPPSHPCAGYAYGLVVDKETKYEAIDAAQDECVSDGGGEVECHQMTAVGTFRQCVAVYWGYFRGEITGNCILGPAKGATRDIAERNALTACRLSHSEHDCKILESACNSGSQ